MPKHYRCLHYRIKSAMRRSTYCTIDESSKLTPVPSTLPIPSALAISYLKESYANYCVLVRPSTSGTLCPISKIKWVRSRSTPRPKYFVQMLRYVQPRTLYFLFKVALSCFRRVKNTINTRYCHVLYTVWHYCKTLPYDTTARYTTIKGPPRSKQKTSTTYLTYFFKYVW